MRFKKIYVEITNYCNLNCSFCSKDKNVKHEMSPQEFDTVLAKIRHYTKTIYLHVKGEPLLHSNFEKILDITKKYNLNVKITTNGTSLAKRLNILQNSTNIRQINISLHSENNLPHYFEDVFKASDKLSKSIPIVFRIWLLNDFQLDTLSTIIVDKICEHYNLPNNFKEMVLKEKNIKIKNNIYLDKDNEFKWPDNIEDNNNIKGTCLGTRNHIAILANGDVIPCCLDSKGILKLGNIFESNLESILNTSLFKTIHEGFKKQELTCNLCKNCHYRSQKFK